MSRIFVASQTGANETYIRTPASGVYNSLVASTIGFWIFLQSGYSGSPIIIVKDPTDTYSTAINVTNSGLLNGQVLPSIGAGAITFTHETVPVDTWTYVTMYYDFSGDRKVYFSINGVPCTYSSQSIAANSTPIDDSGDGFYFGNDTFNTEGFTGDLAEIAIWNTVLTGPQITAAAASTTGVGSIASANLVGYWHLCGTMSPEPDVSGNGNSGVLNGSPPPAQGPDSPGFACSVSTYSISGNAGIAGATVAYTGTSSGSVTADGSGNYTIGGLANGPYTITPSFSFYTFSPLSQNETVAGSNITGVNFTAIPDTWSISGNAGIAGATVAYTGTASGSVTADGSGNYTISGLANGTYTITPSLDSYVFNPLNRVEIVSNANISGVNFTVNTEVMIAEVQISITYQNPGNYLYARDVNSWGDGGTYGANIGQPYALCDVVIGSITLSQPGARLFPLQHVVGYFDAVGTLNNGGSSYPDVWIMPNEISDKKGVGFIQLPEVLQEPPVGQNIASASLLALRWNVNMMNSFLASQFMHHLQIKIQFEPENAPNTIKAIAFGEDQST
jgi:hypothetical protein